MFGKVNAPEFPTEGIDWLNVKEPITLAKLRGRLVVLDFWTYCCVNCIQTLPTLKEVENRFPEKVAVIGVHSPKFEAEHSLLKVSSAIAHYGIEHPVAQDPGFRIWRDYGIRAWPTLVFISPQGTVLGKLEGEPDLDGLLKTISSILGEKPSIATAFLDTKLTQSSCETSNALRFPGKIRRMQSVNGWALADSGHNQIVVVSSDGIIQQRFGSGDIGLRDGPAEVARFHNPQGIAVSDSSIFVADTGNHSLRKIDILSKQVSTLSGTGIRGGALSGQHLGLSTNLASPWDVELVGDLLMFANSGTHQLGAYNLLTGHVVCVAGTSREALTDGKSGSAALAQTSGLALARDLDVLFFLDSETSSLRKLSLGKLNTVSTLIGTGLFDFGHINGPFNEGKLQHPLDLCYYDGIIAIADSYNDCVRLANINTQTISDLDCGDFVCADPICVPLNEPAGIAFEDGEHLLLVDTNNHRILRYSFDTRTYRTWIW